MKNSLSILILALLVSCGQKGALQFEEGFKVQPLKPSVDRKEEARQFLAEVVAEANTSFENIKPTIKNKCFACHDTNTRTPIYGRILRRINPVYQHRKDGIAALDFSKGFPFTTSGVPAEISILKAFREEIVNRTMPLKTYRNIFRSKRVNAEDEKLILAWIDPLLSKLEDYEARFNPSTGNIAAQANRIFEQKCFRCHANGRNQGNFGDMENTSALLESSYINRSDPEASPFFNLVLVGRMPPES